MSKLRCIEVGEGYEDSFTLNKKYEFSPDDYSVNDNGDSDDFPWFYGCDDLCVLSRHNDPDSELVARFEVVE